MVCRLRLPLALGFILALLLAGCAGNDKSPFPQPEPAASVAVPPTTVRETASGPGALSGTAPPRAGRVSATLTGSCGLLEEGSEIVAFYSATVEGGALSEVTFLMDGQVIDSSGTVQAGEYKRRATVKVGDGESHTFQIIAQSGGARSSVTRTISCPEPPADGSRN